MDCYSSLGLTFHMKGESEKALERDRTTQEIEVDRLVEGPRAKISQRWRSTDQVMLHPKHYQRFSLENWKKFINENG